MGMNPIQAWSYPDFLFAIAYIAYITVNWATMSIIRSKIYNISYAYSYFLLNLLHKACSELRKKVTINVSKCQIYLLRKITWITKN